MNSWKLYNWIFSEAKCINDGFYTRERLFNSDFTARSEYTPELPALNDWRKSGWKMELERMYDNGSNYLTEKDRALILHWNSGAKLNTSFDGSQAEVGIYII